jgi:radical SAM protein with 4Fe4S-binding SPASM domain
MVPDMVDVPTKLGGSKTFSVGDQISVKSRREQDDWGVFDEDWGFRIHDIPMEFRTHEKFENFLLAKKEEKERKIFLQSKPYNIVIEPTNVCNLQCPLCSTGIGAKTRTKGVLDLENFKKMVDQIKDTCLQLSLQNWGEATLVDNLPLMIKYAAEKKIFTRLSTNFSIKYKDDYIEKMAKSGLGIIIIDLDGTTQEIYEKYRKNGDLNTVLKNTRKLIKIKKENNLKFPIIQTRMLVMKHNEHQINEFKKLSKELESDEMELGNIQLNPATAKEKWLPNNPEFVYATYQGEREIQPCHWPWSGLTINWDGGVSPCCVIDDQDTDFGNIFEGNLEKIWNNEYYVSARSVFSDTKKITKNTICNICKNDTHNPKLFRIGDTFSITTKTNVQIRK